LQIAWWVWLGVTVMVVRPWYGFVGHSHWARVEWIPFSHRPVPLIDSIANAALFFPLGALQVTAYPASTPARRVWIAIATAFVLATLFELCEVYSHFRLASATDVSTNAFGAFCGAVAFRSVIPAQRG
jgi:glycopeptide antibiotics resistance protein